MNAQFLKKAQYGRVRYYPLNSTARALTKLVKQETLTEEDFKILEVMKQLGLELEVKIGPNPNSAAS